MKKTAKILALVLSLIMVLSVSSAFFISANAAASPSLNVTQTGKSGNTVTVAVNLTDGSFNAMDFQFNTSEGVTCESISASGGYGNKTNGKVSMASIDGYSKGQVITATFKVPEEGSYSITGSASSCTVTTENGNKSVSPSISGSASGSNTKPTSTTTTTKKTTTTTTTKKVDPSKTSTTSKKVDPSKSTAKTSSRVTTTLKGKTTKVSTTSASIPTTELDNEALTSTDVSDEEVTLPDDVDVYGEDIANEDDNWYTGDEDSEKAGEDDEEKPEYNKKMIGAIGGSAAALVAAATAGIVIANKKKKDEDEYDY